jgi:hypothetical protein
MSLLHPIRHRATGGVRPQYINGIEEDEAAERARLLASVESPWTWARISAVLFPVALGALLIIAAVTLGFTIDTNTKRTATPASPVVSMQLNASCTSESPQNEQRRARAYQLRVDTAHAQYALPVPCHPNNGDEALYAATRQASFSKGLDHDALGHVIPASYNALLKAVQSGVPADFDAIPLAPGATRKLTNPQAGLAYVLEGADSHAFAQRPAPTFISAEQAGEAVENYWMAHTRDVNFANYATDPLTIAAAAELGGLSDFRGPTPVTVANLFRGLSPGCAVGPYISQFLYLPCSFGANIIDQRMTPPTAGVDFMKTFPTYLAQQKALAVEGPLTFSPTPVHIRNGRDLSHWVHVDVLFQAYFQAMLCLLNLGAPLKAGIPYQTSALNQMGFGTFGGPHVAQIPTISALAALKSVWYQKWFVHRRLRPEVFGARVHNQKTGAYAYTIHSDILGANILNLIFAAHGSYLLPQAFPEGSPLHPSYGAGHATVAGAAVTILKAFFQEDYVIAAPVMPNPGDGGQTVIPLAPAAVLTVGGELNKLANNVAIGRNIAGVHWRSDATESLRLGEQVAVSILRDMKRTFNEPFAGFSFVDFEGNVVTI